MLLCRICIVFTGVLAIILVAPTDHSAAQATGKRLSILVDASKDGGLWWFPQGERFNPDEYHQGMQLSSRMKDQGWSVTELGRGETIDGSTLAGYDVILLVKPFFRYNESERQAYVQSVQNGAKLFLLGPDPNGGVHAEFGLKFPLRSRFGSADSWVDHAFNRRLEDVGAVWTPALSTSRESVPLAFMGEGNLAMPVVSYLPVANGAVLYIGHSSITSSSTSVHDHLVDSIGFFGSGPLDFSGTARREPTRSPLIAAPTLVSPAAGDLLDQPADTPWQFDWDDVSGAVGYELVVSGRNASIPLIRVVTTAPEFRPAPPTHADEPNDKKPYIADHNLLNWTWRVRARGSHGQWGPWSAASHFHVAPVAP